MRSSLILLMLVFPSLLCAGESIHFENDILPILSRYSCNSSGCHGKAEGQGGFKLSVFGSLPENDFNAITKEGRGRRVFLSSPEESLILKKASGRIAHGGGTKLRETNPDYLTLKNWIASGVPVGSPLAPKLISLRVTPSEQVMQPNSEVQLKVIATLSDKTEKDVTHHTRFQSNAEHIVSVTPQGLVHTYDLPGEAAIMAAYRGEVSLFRVLLPRTGPSVENKLPQLNTIDKLVDAKLKKLNVAPSGLCDDSDYLRRVYLDLIGTLPTPEEARTFFDNKSPDKRQKLVEALLQRDEFADLWALRWADLLRVERSALGHQQANLYYRWIRGSIANNKPFDQFARELVTAEGPLNEVGPANFFKVVPQPNEQSSTLSQVFLGIRITCAECHHHPFDRWKQVDYYGMSAFFSKTPVLHPRTKQEVFAYPLGGSMPEKNPTGDKRELFATWLTSAENPFFAKNLANRVWAWLLGRGLIDPVDDVRATNPASNPELLDFLATSVKEEKYDVRKLIVLIASSRIYQTSSTPNETNLKDEQHFSRAYFKRPDAEVTLDMISQVLGVPEKFTGSPDISRAVQLWDNKARHDFLKLFGRPNRLTACECERTKEPSVSQVLNLLNSPSIQKKLAHEGGTIAKLVQTHKDDAKLVEEMYLTFFSRMPTPDEKTNCQKHFQRYPDQRRTAAEDLAWALLNSTEFLFNH